MKKFRAAKNENSLPVIFLGVLLSFSIAAFFAPSILIIGSLVDSSTRWIFPFLLILYIVVIGGLNPRLRGLLGFWTACLLLYAFLSTSWSTVPDLSLYKSIALILVVVSFSSAGVFWVRVSSTRNIFWVFLPVTLLAIFAGFAGVNVESSTVSMNENVTLYRGLTANSNFLGILVLAALPLPLWLISKRPTSIFVRVLGSIALVALLYLLLNSFSRSSILAASLLAVFFFLGRGSRRAFIAFSAVTVSGLALVWLAPDIVDQLTLKYLYKGEVQATSVFVSRDLVWQDSIEGAKAGGLLGLGYGVSYGHDFFAGGFSASGYGREKGNVLLAIIEEVGLVGFGLFVAIMGSGLFLAWSAWSKSHQPGDRLVLGVLIGMIVSMLVSAQFEAWLFSPGGAATPLFWTVFGMTNATSVKIITQTKARRARLRAQRRISPSSTPLQPVL